MSDSAVCLEQHDDGTVVLVLDQTGRSTNTMNAAYWDGMDAALTQLRALGPALRGVVVTSAKKTFFAGGDLVMLRDARPGDEPQMRDFVRRLASQLRTLEMFGVPVVAAINGSALGGGLEIALACHHRIAVDSGSIQLGSPKVTLGLLPAAKGVIRTVRLLGVRKALANLLLTGASHTPQQARELGIIDELVDAPQQLLDRAREWIAANPDARAPRDAPGFTVPDAADGLDEETVRASLPPSVQRVFADYPLPAPRAVLTVAYEPTAVDFDAAAEIEAADFIELVCGPIATNPIQSRFFDPQTIKASAARRPTGSEPFLARRAAVIGAGMMGAGIAQVRVEAGMTDALVDVDIARAERCRANVQRSLAAAVKGPSLTQSRADEILGRIQPVGDVAELPECDVIVEAVFEDESVKAKVFGQVERALAPGGVLASNTSTIPISVLAKYTLHPDNFLGLHFFSPVPRTPFVEVIAGSRTSPEALARGIDVVTHLRKTPIVVSDSRGFFTSRVILKRLMEALIMLSEGVDPALIDRAAVNAGYPVGPLTLIDELTVSLVDTVRRQDREAAIAEGQVWVDHPGDGVAAAMVHEHDRPGRAAGRGFYEYENGQRAGFWPGPDAYRSAGATEISGSDAADRLLFAEVVDSIRCLTDGVLRSSADANVGSLMGIGFPVWTGGVIQFAVGYPGGASAFAARAAGLAARYGARFELPADWESAAGGSRG